MLTCVESLPASLSAENVKKNRFEIFFQKSKMNWLSFQKLVLFGPNR